MKSILSILIGFFLFTPSFLFAQNKIHINDKWEQESDRSIIPVPQLSIDSEAIYIFTEMPLGNVDIAIIDVSGNTLYSNTFNISSNAYYFIPISHLAEGEYTIILSQERKYTTGYFIIEQ